MIAARNLMIEIAVLPSNAAIITLVDALADMLFPECSSREAVTLFVIYQYIFIRIFIHRDFLTHTLVEQINPGS